MPAPSKGLSKLPPYLFAELDRKIDEKKAKGIDVISLGIGDPDLPTPAAVVEALLRRSKRRRPSTSFWHPRRQTRRFKSSRSCASSPALV